MRERVGENREVGGVSYLAVELYPIDEVPLSKSRRRVDLVGDEPYAA